MTQERPLESAHGPHRSGRATIRWLSSLRYRVALTGLVILLPLIAYFAWDAYEQRRADSERTSADARRLAAVVIETQSRFIQTTKSLLVPAIGNSGVATDAKS